MNKSPVVLFNVRWLSIEEISSEWSKELNRDASIIKREMQLALINFDRMDRGLGRIDALPDQFGPPPAEQYVTREFVARFAAKQHWPLPSFWFPPEQGAERPGRPSMRGEVRGRFAARQIEGLTADSISAEAREIHNALVAEPDGKHIPEPKTIQVHIRDLWHAR
ncbi:MAG: hypothetical protein IPL47_10360 [Phyllobacteriaceae bacterium]|nr:hypothetical protein [Phyllobacteriaceae bacterium]